MVIITMCGRYAVFTEEENQEIREIINDINERFKNEAVKASLGSCETSKYSERNILKGGEVFPTDIAPVITLNENNERVVNLFKWGFPHFKQPSGTIINARSESLDQKPTFSKLLLTKRCLIPASGFYEWKLSEDAFQERIPYIGDGKIEEKLVGKPTGKKDKYLIRCLDNSLFYMAGLYNVFCDSNGINYFAFVIITTDANREMSEIHNRMPVILNRDSQKIWMENDLKSIEKIKELLTPYKDPLIMRKVG